VHIAVAHVFLHQTHVTSPSRQGVTAGMPESVRVDIGDTGTVSRGLESWLKASRVIGPARSELMIGLAANPGTAVEPIWWTVSRIEPSARKRSPRAAAICGHSGLYAARTIGIGGGMPIHHKRGAQIAYADWLR
jgi:hypothetical protein